MESSFRFLNLKIFLVVILGLIAVSATTEGVTVDRVLATINNEPVTLSDYKRFILRSGLSASPETVDENILKNLINNRVVFTEAKKSNIEAGETEILQIIKEFKEGNNLSDEEFKKGLAEEGMTIDSYKTFLREKVISLKFIDREVNSKIAISEKEVEKYYNNNLKLFIDKTERMVVGAIFVKLPVNATLTEVTDLKLKSLKIVSELKRGEQFERMNTLYSDEPLKSHNGLLGEFERGALNSKLDMAMELLKEGEVSDPVWTGEGFYILKLLSKRQAIYVPLGQVRERIYKELYQQKREKVFDEWLKALWEKASVSIKK